MIRDSDLTVLISVSFYSSIKFRNSKAHSTYRCTISLTEDNRNCNKQWCMMNWPESHHLRSCMRKRGYHVASEKNLPVGVCLAANISRRETAAGKSSLATQECTTSSPHASPQMITHCHKLKMPRKWWDAWLCLATPVERGGRKREQREAPAG
jgi:hypothetical protein